jgi:hypothetical protein
MGTDDKVKTTWNDLDTDRRRVGGNINLHIQELLPEDMLPMTDQQVSVLEGWYFRTGGCDGRRWPDLAAEKEMPGFFREILDGRRDANNRSNVERDRDEDQLLASAARDLIAAHVAVESTQSAFNRARCAMKDALKPAEYREGFGLPLVVDDYLIRWMSTDIGVVKINRI